MLTALFYLFLGALALGLILRAGTFLAFALAPVFALGGEALGALGVGGASEAEGDRTLCVATPEDAVAAPALGVLPGPVSAQVSEFPPDAPPEPSPVSELLLPEPEGRSGGIFDLVLRDGAPLDRRLLKEGASPRMLQGLLGVSLAGLGIFGAVLGWVASQAAEALPLSLATWLGAAPALTLPAALAAAFLLALGVCLPSFYFYTQLAGVNAPLTLIAAQALRVQARTGVLLLGALPFFAALALGRSAGGMVQHEAVVWVGLAAPFVLGLGGLLSLGRSFGRLLTVLPITHPGRARLFWGVVLAWGALYVAVCPLALYRIGAALAL